MNGLNYRLTTTSAGPGSGVDTYAACDGDDVAISGGINIADDEPTNHGIADGAAMGSTYPGTDADRSVWRTSAVNESAGILDMSFYGICTDPAGVVAKRTKTKVRSERSGKVRVACPTGYEVAGGGIRSNGPVLASVPYDDDDGNGKPEDGWRVSTYNSGDESMTLTAFASCVRANDWDLTYLRDGSATRGGNTVYAAISCPEGAALTGLGAKARGGEGPHDIRILEFYPFDSVLEDGDAPQEAMEAALGTQSDAIAGMSASGICRS